MENVSIGYTDIGRFTAVSPLENEVKTIFCHTGSDGNMTINLTENKNEIPNNSNLILETNSWLWIYDDEEKSLELPSVKKMSLYSDDRLKYYILIEK